MMLCSCGLHSHENDKEVGSELSDKLEFAEREILLGISVGSTEKGKQACLDNSLVCSGDRAELGLALIASLKTKDSEKSLIKLVRYRLDAALGEDYDAAIADRNATFRESMRDFDAKALRKQCLDEVEDLSVRMTSLLGNIDSNQVCSSIDQINFRLSHASF